MIAIESKTLSAEHISQLLEFVITLADKNKNLLHILLNIPCTTLEKILKISPLSPSIQGAILRMFAALQNDPSKLDQLLNTGILENLNHVIKHPITVQLLQQAAENPSTHDTQPPTTGSEEPATIQRPLDLMNILDIENILSALLNPQHLDGIPAILSFLGTLMPKEDDDFRLKDGKIIVDSPDLPFPISEQASSLKNGKLGFIALFVGLLTKQSPQMWEAVAQSNPADLTTCRDTGKLQESGAFPAILKSLLSGLRYYAENDSSDSARATTDLEQMKRLIGAIIGPVVIPTPGTILGAAQTQNPHDIDHLMILFRKIQYIQTHHPEEITALLQRLIEHFNPHYGETSRPAFNRNNLSPSLDISRLFIHYRKYFNDKTSSTNLAHLCSTFEITEDLLRNIAPEALDVLYNPVQEELDHLIGQEISQYQSIPGLLCHIDTSIIDLIKLSYNPSKEPNSLSLIQFILETFYSYANPGQNCQFIKNLLLYALIEPGLPSQQISNITKAVGNTDFNQIITNTFEIYGVDPSLATEKKFNTQLVDDLLLKDKHAFALFIAKNILTPFPHNYEGLDSPANQELEKVFTQELLLIIQNEESFKDLLKGLFIILHPNSSKIEKAQAVLLLKNGAQPLLDTTPPSQLIEHLLAKSPQVRDLLQSSLPSWAPSLSEGHMLAVVSCVHAFCNQSYLQSAQYGTRALATGVVAGASAALGHVSNVALDYSKQGISGSILSVQQTFDDFSEQGTRSCENLLESSSNILWKAWDSIPTVPPLMFSNEKPDPSETTQTHTPDLF
jgi:hypothetical protein